jgi:hypothetical protein
MGLSPLPALGDPLSGIGAGITDSLQSSGVAGLAGEADLSPSSGTGTSSDNSGLAPATTASGIASGLGKILGAAGNATKNAAISGIGTIFGINSQSITVILGLILVVGGIFLFRPVQELAVSTTKKAAKVAGEAALAA